MMGLTCPESTWILVDYVLTGSENHGRVDRLSIKMRRENCLFSAPIDCSSSLFEERSIQPFQLTSWRVSIMIWLSLTDTPHEGGCCFKFWFIFSTQCQWWRLPGRNLLGFWSITAMSLMPPFPQSVWACQIPTEVSVTHFSRGAVIGGFFSLPHI